MGGQQELDVLLRATCSWCPQEAGQVGHSTPERPRAATVGGPELWRPLALCRGIEGLTPRGGPPAQGGAAPRARRSPPLPTGLWSCPLGASAGGALRPPCQELASCPPTGTICLPRHPRVPQDRAPVPQLAALLGSTLDGTEDPANHLGHPQRSPAQGAAGREPGLGKGGEGQAVAGGHGWWMGRGRSGRGGQGSSTWALPTGSVPTLGGTLWPKQPLCPERSCQAL